VAMLPITIEAGSGTEDKDTLSIKAVLSDPLAGIPAAIQAAFVPMKLRVWERSSVIVNELVVNDV
jgi:hypothetical protein